MREIKFRAWDELNGNMIYQYSLSMPNYEILERYEVVMQYTGLKDKNGKEIYEGDMVSLDDIVCPITFEDGCFMMITNRQQGKSVVAQDRLKRFEVIGNIYENPELS